MNYTLKTLGRFWIPLFFLAVTLIVFRKIIPSQGLIGLESDWILPPFSEQYKDYADTGLYKWNPLMDFGTEGGSPGLELKILFYLMSLLGFDGDIITKILVTSLFFISGISTYYLAHEFKLSRWAAVIAGYFYMLSPSVFIYLVSGTFYIQKSYALLPLALFYYIRGLREGNGHRNFLITIFLFSLIIDVHTLAIVIIVFFIYLFVLLIYQKEFSLVFKAVKHLLLIIFVSAILQSYWIVPLFFDFLNLGVKNVVSASLGNMPIAIHISSIKILDTIRLVGSHLTYFDNIVRSWNWWNFIGFIPLIIATYAIATRPREKSVLFFSLIILLGITLSSGSGGLIGDKWVWILENIPIMRVFRDSTRFYLMTSLGYAVLIAISAETFQNKLKKVLTSKGERFSIFIVFISFVGIISAYSAPYYTGNFGGYMHTYKFNEDYRALYKWLSDSNEDFRVMMMPGPYPTLYGGLERSGYDPMAFYAGKPAIYVGKYYGPHYPIFLLNTFYSNRTEKLGELLGISNVKYVILDENKRTTSTDIHWVQKIFPQEKYSNQKIKEALARDTALVPLDTGLYPFNDNSSIKIYKNEKFIPHIYPVNSAILYAGDLTGLVSLSYFENFSFKDNALVFVNQLTSEDFKSLNSMPNIKYYIQDGSFFDLVLTAVSRNKYIVYPSDYVSYTSPDKGWSAFFWFWHNWFYQAPLEPLVFTFIPDRLSIPFEITEQGNYDLFIKAYYSQRATDILLFVDGKEAANITLQTAGEGGFRWVPSGSMILENGSHKFEIRSIGNGENVITSIVAIPAEKLEEGYSIVRNLMADKQVLIFSELSSVNYIEKNKDSLIVNDLELYDLPQAYRDMMSVSQQNTLPPVDNYTSIEMQIYFPVDGVYKGRIRSSCFGCSLNIEIKGEHFNETSRVVIANGDYIWIEAGDFKVKRGAKKLSITPITMKGKLLIDQLVFEKVEHDYINPNHQEPVNLTFKRINPTRYTINANFSNPYYLVFSEAYHKSWVVETDDNKKIESYPANSFSNLYFINQTESMNLEIVFEKQELFEKLKLISFSSYLVIITLILIPYRWAGIALLPLKQKLRRK